MSEGKTPQPTQPGGAEWSEAPGLIARGACMGAAEVIPGVSGGTMALILGIYPRLIAAISRLRFSNRPPACINCK